MVNKDAQPSYSVSVIIPTKNGGELFGVVLASLRSQQYPGNVEVIVIDSGSSDETLGLAKTYGAKIYVIQPEEFNHGLTRNVAISKSSGDIIVLLTQDAVPADANLIQNLVTSFCLSDGVAGVYARQIPRPDADIVTKRNLNSWLTGLSEIEVRQPISKANYDSMSPVEKYLYCNFDNVCSAISRQAWESLPFTENYFGEDIEWCRRALLDGWKIVYQPSAAVIHSHDRSLSYEYKRTYICHRKLYELFGLRCVPSARDTINSIVQATLSDWRYVLIHEHRPLEKLRLLLKIPALSVTSVMGQYRGARDEANQQGKEVKGV
jgi:rhamnosyltransferase